MRKRRKGGRQEGGVDGERKEWGREMCHLLVLK